MSKMYTGTIIIIQFGMKLNHGHIPNSLNIDWWIFAICFFPCEFGCYFFGSSCVPFSNEKSFEWICLVLQNEYYYKNMIMSTTISSSSTRKGGLTLINNLVLVKLVETDEIKIFFLNVSGKVDKN